MARQKVVLPTAAQTPPWVAALPTKGQVAAIKALQDGKAQPAQQMAAWDYVMSLTGVREMEFRPGGVEGQRASDFASGKRFVGHTLVALLTAPSTYIEKLPER
jgi:hypothetical protein